MQRQWKLAVTLLTALWFVAGFAHGADLSAKMLAKDAALIEINGKQRMLRAGQTSPEGVRLISASRAGAKVEYQGTEYALALQKHIATQFEQAGAAEVRVSSGRGGHYETTGYINGKQVSFMVDTGATTIAMNSHHAEQLGLNYLVGEQTHVNTASGTALAYRIWLDKVAIGLLEVKHVEAMVIAGSAPHTILLGNSYLSLVDMRTENGVLVLTARH